MNEHIQCPENFAVHDGQSSSAATPGRSVDAALIGARLRRYRNARGRTLQDIADFLDTTPQSISRLEEGMMTLSVDWMLRICSVLGVDPAVIVRGDENKEIRVIGTLDDNHTSEIFLPIVARLCQ